MAAVAEIMHAANFAAIKHKDQRRKDVEATPYINHTIGVAHFLTQVLVYRPLKFTEYLYKKLFVFLSEKFGDKDH